MRSKAKPPHISRLTPCDLRLTRTGGGERDRTDDLLLAKQALSQLSYTPDKVVGLDGFEPSTPRLSSVCSNQLSYRPGVEFRVRGFQVPGFNSKLETRNPKPVCYNR